MYQLNGDDSVQVLHPRPSPIAAAMYTLRDIGADVIVLHGPSGCNFRAARLLERDGVAVVTSSLDQSAVIFGAEDRLSETLKKAFEAFHPTLIGVIGTCCAAIIGEDLHRAAANAALPCTVVVVDCNPYHQDNVDGAIRTLEAAAAAGLVTMDELERQRACLLAATKDEHERGTARAGYLRPEEGDDPVEAACALQKVLEKGLPVAVVLNAKKETSLLYADVVRGVCALHASSGSASPLTVLANADPAVGLPLIRSYASAIAGAFAREGIAVDGYTGGLDEYALAGKRAAQELAAMHRDWGMVVVCGLPHAVPLPPGTPSIAVATGTRAMSAMRACGYGHVIDEERAHYSVLGVRDVVRSRFGDHLRTLR